MVIRKYLNEKDWTDTYLRRPRIFETVHPSKAVGINMIISPATI